jgi:hypothetical protein
MAEALAGFTASIERAGSMVEASALAKTDRDRAEGMRRALRQLARAIDTHLAPIDPDHPTFSRGTDRFRKAGLDNPDNLYLWTVLDPNGEYRVSGSRGTTADLVFQVYRSLPGFPDWQGRYVTGGFIDAKELLTDEAGRFEVHLGGEPRNGNWLLLPPDSQMFMVRYTHNDWGSETPGDIRIERIGAEGRPSRPITPAEIVERLERAAFFVEDGTRRYLEFIEYGVGDAMNDLRPLRHTTGGGVPSQVSTTGFFELAEDEALVVTTLPSDSPYQGFQLGNMWFESLEYGDRLTSLTTAQARLSSDGRYHFVVSARDPGVWNWLDTTGLERGMLLLRWQGVTELPIEHQPTVVKLPLSEVRAHLPADEPTIDAAGRREQLSQRQREIAKRFPF